MSYTDREFYNLRSIMGNDWAMFYILIGAREAGKSYAVMDYCLRQWVEHGTPFTWIRLTSISTQKMLANNANKFVDADLVRKYNIQLRTNGMDVYDITRDPEKKKPMAKVLALSEMAKEKGVALFDKDYKDYYNIVCDEFMREPGERKLFDITYNLVGTLENLVRSRKDKVRIFMICNLLENANDVLCALNFIPEEFGRYKLKKKRAVIDYIPPSTAYLRRRKGTVSDILTPTASNFTNNLSIDRSLLCKNALVRPVAIIKFGKHDDECYTIWNDRIIAPYNKEKGPPIIAMRPYLDEVFNPELRDSVILRFDARHFYYRNLITQKRFQKDLELIKGSR